MISRCTIREKIFIRGLPVFIFFIIMTACNRIPGKIKVTISKSVNKAELGKVIQHYQHVGDNRKLRALYFLLENMDYHQHREGPGVEEYKKVFDVLVKTPENKKELLTEIFDSLALNMNGRQWGTTFAVRDFNSLQGKDLIEHIDAAFTAWERPWARHLSFKEFSEYILPYTLMEEEPDHWMIDAQHSYNNLQLNTDNPYKACLFINDEIKRRFKIRSIPSFFDLNFTQLEKIRSGKCGHASQYAAYVMRSFGVPVAVDYTLWGNLDGKHTWNALIYKGKPIPFVGSESDPGKTKVDLARQRKRSKIFRYTYAVQKNELQFLTQGTEEIPGEFRNYYTQDVTNQYIPVSDILVQLNKSETVNYGYLCVFNTQTWMPVYWGKRRNNAVLFKDMGRGIVYLPAKYDHEGGMYAIAPPVILHKNGEVETLNINLHKKRSVNIKMKSAIGPGITKDKEYELLYWDGDWNSLGKKTATDKFIVFDQVPDNTLLWVKSKDKSSHERPFLYKNGEQVWY